MPSTKHRQITAQTNLEALKKEAKRWLRALRASETDARRRFDEPTQSHPPRLGSATFSMPLPTSTGMKAGWRCEAHLMMPRWPHAATTSAWRTSWTLRHCIMGWRQGRG